MKQVTIHNLEESTPQEVFDFVAHHLLTQNERSAIEYNETNRHCLYRKFTREKVLKCAAGILIPDEDYTSSMDKGETNWRYICIKHDISTTHDKLISKLQNIHDLKDVIKWPESLRLLATTYNLDCSIIDQSIIDRLA